MINICTKHGEQFMWKGIMDNGDIKVEFNEDGTENSIVEEILSNENLSQFGIVGNGYYANFNTRDGIFGLFDTNQIRLELIINGEDRMASTEIRNKIIMFRTAESILNPNGGQAAPNVFKYSFGYKLEDDECYIRAIISVDMYEGIKVEMTVTGKTEIVGEFNLNINNKVVYTTDVTLSKDFKKEITVPIEFK